MDKVLGRKTSKKRILISFAVEIVVILILDIILLAKLSAMQDAGTIKGMAIVFTILSVLIMGAVAFLMIREGEEVNKESTVKSDK